MARLPISLRSARSNGDAPPGPLARARAAALDRFGPLWQRMAPRERVGLQLAGAALGVLLFWLIAVQPALDTLRSLPPKQAALDRQWQQMLALATEARELRDQPVLPPAQAEAALRSATERLGAAARLNLQADRVVVTLTDVQPAALMAWLGEVRSAARARVVEAQLRRSAATPASAGALKPANPAPGTPAASASPTGLNGNVVLALQRPAGS
jgi:general secretion pathway protein M